MLLYRPPRKYQKPKPKEEKPDIERAILSFRNEEEYEAAAARAMTPKAKKKIMMEEEKKEPLERRPGLPSVFNNRNIAEQRIQERKAQKKAQA